MVLWACVALPRLSLELAWPEAADEAPADGETPPPGPRAVLDGPAQRAHIVDADAAARGLGIRPGLSPAQAQALCADLVLRRRDPRAEAGRLETLGALAYGFSSEVRLAPPAGVLLEVGASLRLFGDWPGLQRELRARLSALGHAHRIAAAPVPAAAEVFAWLADGFVVREAVHLQRALRRVPLAAAGFETRNLQALSQLGLSRLGELMALPAPGLRRRYGAGVLERLEQLQGLRPDPRPLYQPAERFERRIEFDYGITSSQALLFPLRRLVDELVAYLQVRDGGVPGFELHFEHEGAPASRCVVGLRKPRRDATALLDAARGRLERVSLPHPAQALVLVAEDLPPFQPERRDLFDPGLRGGLDIDALTERLRARLGDEAVRTLAVQGEHRPERAWRLGGPSDPLPASLPPRPSWLLERPVPLRQRVLRVLDAGEVIESGWWDGEDVRREYHVAELASGQRAWVFRLLGREAAPAPAQERHWMLHGWFA